MENPPAMMGQKSFTGSGRWFYCQIARHMKILGPEFGTSASTGESRERPQCCKPRAGETEKGGSLGFLVNQPRDSASSVLNNNLVSNNRRRAIEEDIQEQPLTSTHMHMCLHTCMYTHTHTPVHTESMRGQTMDASLEIQSPSSYTLTGCFLCMSKDMYVYVTVRIGFHPNLSSCV